MGTNPRNLCRILSPFLYYALPQQGFEIGSRLKRVDFIPKGEDSRIVPLTAEDYTKINNLLKNIDIGMYAYPYKA